MIKLAKLTDYAVVILGAMVQSEAGRLMSAASLAAQTGLGEATVAKILKMLARGGLIIAVRGAAGGYRLARPAGQIGIAAIIEVMEGPIALAGCVKGSADHCIRQAECSMTGRWQPVNDALYTALSGITLADMAAADEIMDNKQEARL